MQVNIATYEIIFCGMFYGGNLNSVTVGRRVINPVCGYQFAAASSGTRQFEDFIEPGYINFYAISPNYFYEHNDYRKVRISRSSGIGSLVVCHSRSVLQPRCVLMYLLTN